MTIANSPANRYPYQHPDPHTNNGFRLLFQSSADLNQAIVTLKSQIEANKADITNVTRTVTTTVTNTPATGGSFPVNVQQQTADYILQQTDVLGLNVFTGTGPYALELNTGVVKPFLTAVLNLSSGVITATPTATSGALVNNLASVTIATTQWAWFFFDGVNWWALDLQVWPQTFTAVTNQFLKDYDATTGLFTAAQPQVSDIGWIGGATGSRPGSPVLYQPYFDTTLGYQINWNGSAWVNGSGTPV